MNLTKFLQKINFLASASEEVNQIPSQDVKVKLLTVDGLCDFYFDFDNEHLLIIKPVKIPKEIVFKCHIENENDYNAVNKLIDALKQHN